MDIWGLIQDKNYQSAIELADEEFKNTKRISSLRNKITALALLNKYDEIIATEEIIVNQTKGSTDSDFIFWGIALWAQGKRLDAISKWKEGENCTYTDAGGGIELNIILYFALLKVHDEKSAARYLKKVEKIEAKSKGAKYWPFPLGAFLLNHITFDELKKMTSDNPILNQRQLCQAYFAKSIKELEKLDLKNCQQTMEFAVAEYQDHGILEQMYFVMKADLSMV